MQAPRIYVPPARSAAALSLGAVLPISKLLPKPVHFVLAGGGSRGAVQWGLLQALSETDLRPDSMIGTSAGALSGVVVAEDPGSGMNRLAYIWAQLDTKFVIGDNWLASLTNARESALMENTAIKETLESVVGAHEFHELAVPFATVATDLATGLPHVIDSGPLIPALLASSAIPGLLPPVEVDGRLLVDGLASANLPAIPAVERGAGSIVVLDTGARSLGELGTSSRKVIARLAASLSAVQRRNQLTQAASEVPVVLLPTPDNLGGTLDFGATMSAASETYSMTREFLLDLVRNERRKLTPGLYVRPDSRESDAISPDLLRPVTT